MPNWTKEAVDRWIIAAGVSAGRIFRAVSRHGTPCGEGISENVVRYVVRRCAERIQLFHLAPDDLRRTCAKLCHVNGGEIEQIPFLVGHASVLTTERYLGCKQNLEKSVNDRFGSLYAVTRVELRYALKSKTKIAFVGSKQPSFRGGQGLPERSAVYPSCIDDVN